MTITGIWLATSLGFLFGYIACGLMKGATANLAPPVAPVNLDRCRLCNIARRLGVQS